MKRVSVILLLLFFICLPGWGQISYGGKPLPLFSTRSGMSIPFEKMPAFDLEEELRLDSLNSMGATRGAYRFAYKFITDFTPANSGQTFTLADGTRVWRLGIRSKGAYSINVLFTEFEIPEGARLFLYNSDQSHVLGSFTHQNNSDLRIFPVSPVSGDELIIEYQEPPNVAFHGYLRVGEVNHAYRSLRDKEPGGDQTSFNCMEPLACFPDDPLITEELGRSTVLLIIDGISSCTGVMINNTSNDGSPYILTASHCINKNFGLTTPAKWEVVAGSIICFFNYNSPLCQPALRGTEEMSMSSTTLKALNPHVDMALLELQEMPPAYYQPYYAGWNRAEMPEGPYFGIHHPSGSVKRLNWFDGDLEYGTFDITLFDLTDGAHWHVKEWTAGSTAIGSSGSPLFDGTGRVIGSLSGGNSYCTAPEDDFYFALSKAWIPEGEEAEGTLPERQLAHWLDPLGKAAAFCDGLDPYAVTSPCLRLSNARGGEVVEMTVDTLPVKGGIPLFSNNIYGVDTYVESYQINGEALLYGTYIVNPAVARGYDGLEVEICVYSGDNSPTTLLHAEPFHPKYADYYRKGKEFTEREKTLNRAQESFISFTEPVRVKNRFFVGYKIKKSPENVHFTAYNRPASLATANTTWLLHGKKWIEATQHPEMPMKTSLYVDPVISYTTDVGNTLFMQPSPVHIFQSADRRLLHILLPEKVDNARLAILALNGATIQEQLITSNQTTLNAPPAPSGIYLVRIAYGKEIYTQKIML